MVGSCTRVGCGSEARVLCRNTETGIKHPACVECAKKAREKYDNITVEEL